MNTSSLAHPKAPFPVTLSCRIVLFLLLLSSLATGSRAEEKPRTQTFRVEEIRLTGNTVIAEAALRPLLAPYEGKEVTPEEMQAGVAMIQKYYRDRGYLLAQAYLPIQEVGDGVVRVEIVEGKIGEISIEGNRFYPTPFIRDRLAVGLPGGIFRQGSFQKSLLLLNELPDLKVEPVLQAGKEPGTADLQVKVQDKLPAHVGFEYDNFGSRNIGKHRASLSGSIGNLLGVGDLTSSRLIFASSPSKGSHPFYQMVYSLPINRLGSRAALSYSNSVFRVGGEFEALDIRGAGRVGSLSVIHPLHRTPTGGADLSAGLSGKSSKNQILGIPASQDELRLLTVAYQANGTAGLTSRHFLNVEIARGLGENFGGMADDFPLASRRGGDNSFTKATVGLAWLEQFSPRWHLLLRGTAQGASQTLVAMEQYAVGGPGSVRGFSQSTLSGDEGYTVSAELRATFFGWRSSTFQGAIFADYGMARLKDPLPDQPRRKQITGGGIGLQAGFGKRGMARLDLGFPLDPDENPEDKSPLLHSQVAVYF